MEKTKELWHAPVIPAKAGSLKFLNGSIVVQASLDKNQNLISKKGWRHGSVGRVPA
jgi:hypothetical protein